MDKDIFKLKKYKHIDKKILDKNQCNIVKSKNFVIKHGFYPFISYTIRFKKYADNLPKDMYSHWKPKERPIKYASHIDRSIYQWYSYMLNTKYNSFCIDNNFNDTPIAYRTSMKGKSNIEFAKCAFDSIKKEQACYIIVSDFTNFFDNIEHEILKNNLCKILNVKMLDDDWYKIYRNMTRFAYVDKQNIEDYLLKNKIETKDSLKKLNSYFDNIEWNKAKKNLKININKNNYGIPQGSPISGIFANIYMMNFDKSLSDYIKEKNGLYMRYSDDLIVVIPKSSIESVNEIINKIDEIKSVNKYNNLKISKEKTNSYLFENKKVYLLKDITNKIPSSINYLGFSFDGKYVKFRDKTLTKFYYKLYRKIDNMKSREKKRIEKGRKRHSLIDKRYILKTLKSNKETRKFIDYVNRANRVFKKEKYIKNFKKNVENKIFIRFEKNMHFDHSC